MTKTVYNNLENGLALNSLVANPNSLVKKRYGIGMSVPYGMENYDYSGVNAPAKELPKDEGFFSNLGNKLELGGGSNGNTTDKGVFGTIGEWFTPQGASGASVGGNVLSGLGTAVGIGSGLAGMYYASKKAKLDKERAGMEKDVYNRSVQRDSENEARMQQLAKNAGNNAFYKA